MPKPCSLPDRAATLGALGVRQTVLVSARRRRDTAVRCPVAATFLARLAVLAVIVLLSVVAAAGVVSMAEVGATLASAWQRSLTAGL